MEINVRHEQGRVDITVFAVKGDIASDSYEQLQERFDQEHKHGTTNLLLDLKNVSFVSSGGLRAIHHIFSSLEGNDEAIRKGISAGTYRSVHFKLANPSKNVRGILKTTGYDCFLDIYDDTRKAIAAF